MATSLTVSTLQARIQAALSESLDLQSRSSTLDQSFSAALTNGTGANQADTIWSDQRTTDQTGEDLDLAGSLTDAFGATVTFARIKAIMIKAAAGNTHNVLVGGAASNQFATWVGDATDVIAIRPGGFFALAAPDATAYAVTAGTGDLLHVEASATGSVTYDIILIGASA